ncbi:class I SAM-dependent methyltransferase [Pseudonocardia sp. HH130630-07]|uniref:class I SAM-dependent methyltransferase n=1 Tax=Pseudonocardia sp. HH130630-07 TaxID=1690815 RepID=UPI0008150D7C|nr:class I SAM-dependent methyltransferase [Pseudonocardia sp. HH130630-07]ANY07058.1 hypothetical protein AFB00_13025 [Pseudonocardia sp. HH130630-07]
MSADGEGRPADPRARSFGAAAREYERFRPGYPDAAVGFALGDAGGAGSRVLDLGAGTGKLTASLLARGLSVTAVEPDPEMLAVLRGRFPGLDAVPGAAERIPLPDGSVDAVVAGQAVHWFDPERSAAEIVRVLRPGGTFAGLWNGADGEIGWIAGLDEVRTGSPAPVDNPAGGGEGPGLPGAPWFTGHTGRVLRWTRPTTTEDYLANQRTHS